MGKLTLTHPTNLGPAIVRQRTPLGIGRLIRLLWKDWRVATAFLCAAVVAGVLYPPLLLTDTLVRVLILRFSRRLPLRPVDTVRVTVIIVSWNGRELLAAGLPPLIRECRRDGAQHDILVVDNGSNDGSVEYVRKSFPEVRVLALSHNYGFGEGNNRGVREADTDVVVFLNNDMVVQEGFLGPLLRRIAQPGVFAVASQIFFQDPARRREETGLTRGELVRGRLRVRHAPVSPERETEDEIPVLWAGGGSAAFRRQAFLALGGFDALYAPFYWEDSDLSYRAWKAGWRCVFAPESQVLHRHQASTSRFGRKYVAEIVRRNEYLFHWRNLTDSAALRDHFAFLPIHAARETRERGLRFTAAALLRATVRYPAAAARRPAALQMAVRMDAEVLALANAWPPADGSPSIDFATGGFECQLGRGWHGLEGQGGARFRWIGGAAEAYLHAGEGGARLVVEGFLADHVLALARGKILLKLLADGTAVGVPALLDRAGAFRVTAPLPPARGKWRLVEIVPSFSYVPAERGLGPDGRELSLCIRRLALMIQPNG